MKDSLPKIQNLGIKIFHFGKTWGKIKILSTPRNRHLVRWENKWSFDGQLCLKYSNHKLLKSDNLLLSYDR